MIQPVLQKTIHWVATDNMNNDDYDPYYNRDCAYTIDSGMSSLITERELIDRFINVSEKVLQWREEHDGEKLFWEVVKHDEGSYFIEYWSEAEYVDKSILTTLDFTIINTFQII